MKINSNFYLNNYDFSIKKNNQENKTAQTPSFCGMTSVMKKAAYDDPLHIAAMLKKVPNPFVGSFPVEWIEKIDKPQRADKIKTIQKGFSEAIKELQKPNIAIEEDIQRFVRENESILNSPISMEKKLCLLNDYISKTQQEIDPSESLVNAKKMLKNLLSQNGICKKIDLRYVGSGEFGNVYRLTADDKEYALKIYKTMRTEPKDNIFEKLFAGYSVEDFKDEMKLHGKLIEANRAFYWQQNVKKHQNARMYFADLENGGSLSQYIGFNAAPPKKIVDATYIGLEHTDLRNASNTINDWVVDGGGQKVINHTIVKNKEARKIYYKLAKTPDDKKAEVWNDIFKSKHANRHDVELGLVNALQYMDIKTIGKLNIPPATLDKWIASSSIPPHIKRQLVNKKLFF